MSRWKIALIVIVVIALALFGLSRCQHHRMSAATGTDGGKSSAMAEGQKGDNAAVPVTVVEVVRKDVPVYLSALGTAQALHTVNVRPQVSGQLLRLTFTEGHEVKKGDVIAKIDPRAYQSQYDKVVAQRNQNRAQLATARGNLKRSEGLIRKGFIAQQDLDTQRNTVQQLEAAIAGDNASIRDAKVNLDYTNVTAPITGLAGIRETDPGNVLSTSDIIVVLNKVRPIDVTFTLPEQDLGRVRRAQNIHALPVTALDRVDSHVIAADGELTVINNQIDTSTGTFRMNSEFMNKNNELWPGQFVNVRMQIDTVKGGLVVPTQAVQRGPDGNYVYVVDAEQKVQMRTVTVAGEASNTESLIGSGLKFGERVVTEGQFRLKPGRKVKAYKPGEVPKAPSVEEIKKATQKTARRR